jgi:hypothetical protein
MPEQFTWPGWGGNETRGAPREPVPNQNIAATGSTLGARGEDWGPFRGFPGGGFQTGGAGSRWSNTNFQDAARRQRMTMPNLMSMFPQGTMLSRQDIPGVQTDLALQTWLQNVMHERPAALEHLGGRPQAYGMAQQAAQQLIDPAARQATFNQLASALRGQGAGAAGVARAQLAAQTANRGIGGNLADYQQALLGQSQRQTLAGQLADLRAQQQQMQDQAYGTGGGILGGLSQMDLGAREALARLAIEQPITMPDLSALMVEMSGAPGPRLMPVGAATEGTITG